MTPLAQQIDRIINFFHYKHSYKQGVGNRVGARDPTPPPLPLASAPQLIHALISALKNGTPTFKYVFN
jgi:hypothetical protein